ncbi:hypothetical protein [Candidatus Amarobacter glycogenicus]|uniref:hypothetical protein n=1 Tax=Candidatus Amarobacter glycogenicus TaxID=3140699 RepID=UPI002A0F10F9|nr:hypothetical protein [Dehalococcoidia bacterium]
MASLRRRSVHGALGRSPSQREPGARALDRRKSAWRQALLMGVGTLLKLAVGRLSLPDAERVATRIFQVRGRAVVAPYAAIGMDVDKPFQYDIVRQRMG